MNGMDDLISRQAAIDAVHEEFDDCLVWDESGQRTADEFEFIIDRLPSAQTEIIRCKDCEFKDGACCDYSAVYVHDNGYCNWGRRRE